ncbi:MAG: hypothetical protein IJZ70_03625 [Bacteroidales bacterium]|nr:hypothetical protein [Bacteroidales bacterium]MBQ8811381.1 hypothetical protein [Bacteroidales bacterium]
MKKIALFLMAAFAVMACEEEFVPHVDFTPAEVTIPTAGTENLETPVTFTFNANAAWTAALTGEGVAEWLSITPKSGEAGEATITFNATANDPGKDNRVATLEITVEGLEPVLVNVTQLQKNAIDVNAEDAYVVPFAGGTVEVEVGANVGYTYEVTGGEEWLVQTKAYTTDKLTFTVAPQPEKGAERSATLTVYSELGVVKIVSITQKEWTPIIWSQSLVDNGAKYGRVGVAVVGDKVYYTAGGELWTVDEATGANATKVALPEGFVAGGVHADDAGNLLVSGEDRAPGAGQLQLFKVNADGTHTAIVDYNSANYWCTEMGNLRVKGDVTKNALITAYICVGTGHYAAWEVKDGVVSDPVFGDLPSGSWDASTGVVAPAGPAMTNGLYSITYGGNYSISYYDGSAWTEVWVSGSSWMENYNCISTAEVDGKKYLALTASSHFSYDMTELIVLDVTDLSAVNKVYSIQMQAHTQTTEIDAATSMHGLTYSDVAMVKDNGSLAIYVVDSWMDSVEKYLMNSAIL